MNTNQTLLVAINSSICQLVTSPNLGEQHTHLGRTVWLINLMFRHSATSYLDGTSYTYHQGKVQPQTRDTLGVCYTHLVTKLGNLADPLTRNPDSIPCAWGYISTLNEIYRLANLLELSVDDALHDYESN